jgi:predicted GNAT family acetyltransferase
VSFTVRDRAELNRYELLVDDRVIGVAEYRRLGDVVVLPHTVIEPDKRGRGWGELLVKETLDDLRLQGVRVQPRCWFVAEFIEQHSEYVDLLA